MDLDLAQVRAFVAVVDHGHFGRAAKSLLISQQALSKRVARLEDRLSALLVRSPAGVGLTDAGRRFLPPARQLLEISDAAVADTRAAPPSPVRVDVWGELQTPAVVVRSLAHDQPGLLVEFSMRRDLDKSLAALRRHEIDLAFGNVAALPGALGDDLSARLVFTDTIDVMVSARSPVARRTEVTPADLARHGIWWPMAGSSQELRAFAVDYAQSIGAELVADTANLGLDALIAKIAADPHLIAPIASTWPVRQRCDVHVLPLNPAPHYPWHVVWRTAFTGRPLRQLLQSLPTLTVRQGESSNSL